MPVSSLTGLPVCFTCCHKDICQHLFYMQSDGEPYIETPKSIAMRGTVGVRQQDTTSFFMKNESVYSSNKRLECKHAI